jgi:hypothetical protein
LFLVIPWGGLVMWIDTLGAYSYRELRDPKHVKNLGES